MFQHRVKEKKNALREFLNIINKLWELKYSVLNLNLIDLWFYSTFKISNQYWNSCYYN